LFSLALAGCKKEKPESTCVVTTFAGNGFAGDANGAEIIPLPELL